MTLVSKDEPTEDVPLQEFTNSELIEDGLNTRKEADWCITKPKLVLLSAATVTLIVVIIVLVVLFGMEKQIQHKGMFRILDYVCIKSN